MSPSPGHGAAVAPDDGRDAAREAGLRYSTDDRPGIGRRRRGRGFSYHDPDGSTIRDPDVLDRIRRLAIPPAWTDVWICRWPNGHLQATGHDARGRKQYRYHERWTAQRGTDKFDRMLAFAAALPKIRKRCDADLAKPGIPRDKVLAAVVRLLEQTLIRVGNDEYAKLNRSFGLTTLRGRHARVDGSTIRFRFRGKSGRLHEVGLRDRRLAGVVRRCQELPGQELFQYVDADGEAVKIDSDDVNDYIEAAAGERFTAKDFRTWAGTVLAYRALRALQPEDGAAPSKRTVVEAIRRTADGLGNTPTVARGSYVHPAILDAYLDGSLRGALVEVAEGQAEPPPGADPAEERAVVALLRQASTPTGRKARTTRRPRAAR
jgi:DNA topoisomerase-1